MGFEEREIVDISMKSKNTKIGMIPKEWGLTTLDEVAEINKETVDPTKSLSDKKFLYIDIDSVENGTGVIRDAKEIFGKNAPSRARRMIHHNDVLMSTVRPYLKAFTIVPKELDNQICSTGFAVLTCKEKILPLYLLYSIFSKSVIDQCNRMMVGGQYPALSSSQVEKLKLSLPPLPEQQKIAEILSTADEAIQKVDEAIEKTERLKKGLLQELLTKGIGHKEFKETEIGRIPKEWEVENLSEVCSLEYGKGLTESQRESGKYPVFGSNGIVGYHSGFLIKGPGIVVGRKGTIGAINWSDNDFWPIDTTYFVKLKDKEINLKWFYYRLILLNLSRLNTATGTPGLNRDLAYSQLLPLPPLPEQQKISEILSTVDKRLKLLREKKERFERVKRGLMDNLLTGKKRVKLEA